MSLRDTIEGARREAEGNAAGRPKKEVATVVGEEKKGFSKSSASKARPAREAAASVRTPLRRFAPRSLGYCILLRLAGFIQVVMSFFFVNYLQFRKILKNLYGGSIQFARAVRPRRQKRSPRNGGPLAVFLSLSD